MHHGAWDEICTNSLATCYERLGLWRLAVAKLGGGGQLAGQAWRQAKLGRLQGGLPPKLKPGGELPDLMFTWAAASLGINVPELAQQMWHQLEAGAQLSGRELSQLAWALAMLEPSVHSTRALHRLQLELAQMCRRGRVDVRDALTVLWSASFSDCLSARAAETVWETFGRPAALLQALEMPTTGSVRLVKILPGQFVIYKPPGWQVDYKEGRKADRGYLSSFLHSIQSCRLPQNGFLHRLDVPSSGLILAARSLESFFDLKLQLATGKLLRDYLVLSHGWPSFRSIEVAVHWLAQVPEKPSEVGKGLRACSSLRPLIHSEHRGRAIGFSRVHIKTGRRHQIRLHLAHVGCPILGDNKYTAVPCHWEDMERYGFHGLHRCGLTFLTGFNSEELQVYEALPHPMQQFILKLRVTRNVSEGFGGWKRPSSSPPLTPGQLSRPRTPGDFLGLGEEKTRL